MKILTYLNKKKDLIKTAVLMLLLVGAIGIIIWVIFIGVSSAVSTVPDVPEMTTVDSMPATDKNQPTESLPTDSQNRINNDDNQFYGSSLLSQCSTDNDCVVQGCNSEVCGAATNPETSGLEDEFATICVFPSEPLPQDLGYSCGCNSNNECQWQL